MKKTLLLLIPALLLFGCKKENGSPRVETTISGSKWDIKIGSSYADVYAQLQKSGQQNNFNEVDIINQKQTFTKPEEIQQKLKFYSMILLQKNTTELGGISIDYDGDKITSITGPGPALISKWPQDAPDESALHQDEAVNNIYTKLLAIYKLPDYANYQITLAYKALTKPFDPDMANYNEWAFYITKYPKPGISGTYYIRLLFNNGKLSMIRSEYKESQVYN
nr:hypothetical protein [Mucilaginibacter sp. L294]